MLMVSTHFLAQCETVVEGRADNNLGNWELFQYNSSRLWKYWTNPSYENIQGTHPVKILREKKHPSYEYIEPISWKYLREYILWKYWDNPSFQNIENNILWKYWINWSFKYDGTLYNRKGKFVANFKMQRYCWYCVWNWKHFSLN